MERILWSVITRPGYKLAAQSEHRGGREILYISHNTKQAGVVDGLNTVSMCQRCIPLEFGLARVLKWLLLDLFIITRVE